MEKKRADVVLIRCAVGYGGGVGGGGSGGGDGSSGEGGLVV